jgi:hypothetical protein
MMLALVMSLAAQRPLTRTEARNSKVVAPPLAFADDEIAVYWAFLTSYSNGSSARMNLGDRTVPFKLSDAGRSSGCLKGIVLQDLASAQSMSRTLDAEIVVGANAALVDPEKQTSAVEANDPSGTIRPGDLSRMP